MRECKIIHINDGNEAEMTNGNRFYAESFPRAEEMIGDYLRQGYQVVHMVPDFTPSVQEEGCFSFYKTGWSFYLEREV